MALPADFSKIFGSTATGGLTPIGDVNYAKGWEFVGSNPPTKNDFSYLQNLSDLKSQWLYSNKLQRTDPFGDIKSDGAAAVAAALSNLGLGTAATRNVGTAAGTVAAGNDSRFSQIIGVGQAWTDVTASRSPGVLYTNNTGKPIQVGIYVSYVHTSTHAWWIEIDGVSVTSSVGGANAIIPTGSTYKLSLFSSATLVKWMELR